MRKVIDDPRLMVRVCDLYYNQGISQQQIAKDLNLSRPTVSRVLALAREQGIVKISISNVDAVEHWELERKLEKEYGLQEVIIVGENSSEDKMKEALGEAAARYLEYTIKDGNTVGVSMGSTLYEVISGSEESYFCSYSWWCRKSSYGTSCEQPGRIIVPYI